MIEKALSTYGPLYLSPSSNRPGYHELPAAAGATKQTCPTSYALASERMSSGDAPRPCSITIATRASASGTPDISTRWPAWTPTSSDVSNPSASTITMR